MIRFAFCAFFCAILANCQTVTGPDGQNNLSPPDTMVGTTDTVGPLQIWIDTSMNQAADAVKFHVGSRLTSGPDQLWISIEWLTPDGLDARREVGWVNFGGNVRLNALNIGGGSPRDSIEIDGVWIYSRHGIAEQACNGDYKLKAWSWTASADTARAEFPFTITEGKDCQNTE